MDLIERREQIRMLFREEGQPLFDFSKSPNLIRYKNRDEQQVRLFGKRDLSRWRRAQRSFGRWVRDKRIITEEFIENYKLAYSNLFERRGSLRGNVLDIGGGWGSFRQWWEPEELEVFVVHEPWLEGFLRGPHRLDYHHYQRALSLPMSFVEGFGEELPYRDGIFDTCLVVSTLDHCIDPRRVMMEAHRCLKSDGAILVMQDIRSHEPDCCRIRKPKVLLGSPHLFRRVLSKLYSRLFYRDHHLHHFAQTDVTSLLEEAGFSGIDVSAIPTIQGCYAFEGKKKNKE